MNKLWLRRATLLVAGKSIEFPPLRIDFRVDFDDDPEPNMSEIKIYNLSQDTISKLKKGVSIILNAGYEGNLGTIFTGGIVKATTEWEGVDKITTIDAGDGADEWLKAKVSKTFKQGIKASQVISDIVGGFGLEVGEIKLANDITYTNGKSVHGSLQQVLRQIVIDTKSKLTITNGVIMIRPPNVGTQTGFLLNSSTGLIGTPGRIDSDEADYSVECLLNHRITANSLLRIESRTANGNFRVVKGSHEGNESNWMTKMEVKAV